MNNNSTAVQDESLFVVTIAGSRAPSWSNGAGYRIAKSYYQHAGDKGQALREMLELTDAEAFLARSGRYPGIKLEQFCKCPAGCLFGVIS